MEKPEKPISFNVGGIKYLTTLSTLREEPENLLLEMLSGKFLVTKHKNAIFLDRDGESFRYVLDYLRNTEAWVPPSKADLDSLIREADFYLLPGMKKILEEFLPAEEEKEKDPYLEVRKKYPIIFMSFHNNKYKNPNSYDILISDPEVVQSNKNLFSGHKQVSPMKNDNDKFLLIVRNNCNILFEMGYRLIFRFAENEFISYIFQSKD